MLQSIDSIIMKTLILVSLVLLCTSTLFTNILVAREPGPVALRSSYTLVWSDEFDGSKLDLTRWVYRTDSKHGSTQLPVNVTVFDGMLHLALKKGKVGDDAYTGAGVISRESFMHGYYEARMKVPLVAGWHSSFWMMKHDGSGGTSPVLATQELDVLENDSVDPYSYPVNVHIWNPGPHRSLGKKRIATPDLSEGFHVFGCEFTAAAVKYYLDGQLVQTVDAASWVHGDQHVWLTSITSHIGGKTSVDDSKLPGVVEVDWVRFYETK
jgi:beta-glucanase (GH16 family)